MADEMTTKKDAPYYPAETIRQTDANYTTVSPQTGVAQCANCRFFMWAADDTVSGCTRIEPYPDPILPTGYCDLYEKREPVEPAPLEVVIVDRAYIAPEPVQTGIVSRFLNRAPPQTTITRGADGLRLGVIVTSNGYRDRENEHVLKAALQAYVDTAYDGETYVAGNRLDFWHHKNLDIGDIISADLIAGFLVEVAKERDTPIAKSIWDYWERTASDGSIRWGASQEFLPKVFDGTHYEQIEKRKTSILPLDAAANIATLSGVIRMSTQRNFHIDAALGFDGAAELLDKKGLTALVDELAKRGVQAKTDNPEDKPTPESAPLPDGITALITGLVNAYSEMGQAQEELMSDVDGLKALKAEVESARTKAFSELKAAIDALDTRFKAIESQLADAPRSAAAGTAAGVSDPAIDKDLQTPQAYDPRYPGMKVPAQL